ncbi:DEAD/DEAH box helicase [Blastococcus brunescens]|uniref:DEAD/DEAH box helicase n=1 Tax=Blastococcus brunescens TaxID=1564165 RepID=A0ABZ1B2V0_9ACTN|nr:DEAD/DEAH box helicase [Blastococcus sp. BMG 8361]WRL63679.1 DEAD/DEAH box helicase [Blastococcus sp. BMG 8361]
MDGERDTGATAANQAGTTFEELGLRPELLAALAGLGYEEATPIQQEAIPRWWRGGTCSARPPPAPGRPQPSRCRSSSG